MNNIDEQTLRTVINDGIWNPFRDIGMTTLLTTTADFDKHILERISLRSLFFDTDKTLTLPSKRVLVNLNNIWTIPQGYQRHFIKDMVEQQELLLAILRGEVHSQYIFGITPTGTMLDVIDAQQRLVTLQKFFNNVLALPTGAVLKFIGHSEGKTISASEMKFEDFTGNPIYEILINGILDEVKCNSVIHEAQMESHIKIFKSLNTGNSKLVPMETITAEQNAVMAYARDFNNFGIVVDDTDDPNWEKLCNYWDVAGLNGKRYGQAKLILQCVGFEKYGWGGNITSKQMIEFGENDTISKSWKDIFHIFTKLHTTVILSKKDDIDNSDLWGLQGWRVFLSFIRVLYRQEDSMKIVVKDYEKFWEFSEDLMKNLRTTLGVNPTTDDWFFDEMKSHPKNNEKLVFGLVREFDKVFGSLGSKKNHDSFLKATGISVRDGNRAIDWKTKSLVWQTQDGKCNSCDVRVGVHNDGDHMHVEWSVGGNNKADNVQILCDSCHKDKTSEFVRKPTEDDE